MLHTRICPLYRSTEWVTCTFRSLPVIIVWCYIIFVFFFFLLTFIMTCSERPFHCKWGEFNNARARGRTLFWYLALFVKCKALHQYNECTQALVLLNSPLILLLPWLRWLGFCDVIIIWFKNTLEVHPRYMYARNDSRSFECRTRVLKQAVAVAKMKPQHPLSRFNIQYLKTCLNDHSKIDKTKVLMTNGSLMKVESIAECFCNTSDLH